MGIKKLLTVAALLAAGGLTHSAWAQTDVTSTYLTNADFEESEALTSNVFGYGKDKGEGDVYGLQSVSGWEFTFVNTETDEKGFENGGLGGGVFSYGSTNQMKGNSKSAPAASPNETTGNCLGFFAVWSCGAYYYQDVTLPAGLYEMTTSIYNQSGTQSNTSYVGFIPEIGDSYTMPVNTTVGQWVEQSVKFTLATETPGKIVLGYVSTGGGSANNPHIFIDNVTITYTSFSDVKEPNIDKRTDIGGIAVDLNDFNVGAEDYTLEVQGTVGTEINIAAENISYTPTADGLVRFVKHEGVVYAYEGAAYKELVLSEKAPYSYNNELSADDPVTNNLLQNPSFEILGSQKTGSQYNIGEPWEWNLVNVGNIRVDDNSDKAKHGDAVLVWRGSGNNSYFSQEVSSIKPYKGYKIYVSQVANGNANANFIIGLGNDAGGYAKSSKNEKFGTGQDGIHIIELVNNSVSGGYFTFRNTSNNTASLGEDPVSQIDWVGMVASDPFAITGAISASVLYGTAYAPAGIEDAKVVLQAKIDEAKVVDVITNVGDKVFQIPLAAVETFKSAINEAQNVYNNATELAEFESATATLNGAIEAYKNAELNAPAENTRYAIQSVANWIDFTRDNKDWDYLQDTYYTYLPNDRNDHGLYNIKLGYAKNSNYGQAFAFEAVEGTLNGYKIYQTDGDGNNRYISTGVPYGGYTAQIRTTTESEDALVLVIIPTEKEGVYNLYNTESETTISPQDAGLYCSAYDMDDVKFVEAAEATVDLNIAAGKYATRVFPFAAEIPAGVTVYSCATIEGQTLILSEEDAIAPNVPYILYSEEGVETTLTGYGTAKQDSYTVGLLTGVYGTGTVTEGCYVLQTQEGVQGFYKVAETAVDYAPYRAYLTVPSANAKAFFFGGDATAINGVEGAEGATEVVRFNAAGVQVAAPVKGLNIVKMSDGTVKKVMVK